MKTKLTLQEKLRDLRDERKITLAELAEATNIPLSTLQRAEGQDDVRMGYQDVAVLAMFYGVSTDYLFGLTDNRQHRHIEIDALRLSDAAIETLKGGNLNNRLISELLSHDDFQQLISAVEVYLDRKMLPQMSALNATYEIVEAGIKGNYAVGDDDAVIEFLKDSVIDEDEFLRYRISERFNALMKSMFEAHKKDGLPPEQAEAISEMKDMMQTYIDESKAKDAEKAKSIVLCKQLGLDASGLDDDEWRVLLKMLKKSARFKQGRRKRGKP